MANERFNLLVISVVLAVALYVIISGAYSPEVENSAFVTLGLILGSILEQPVKRGPPPAV